MQIIYSLAYSRMGSNIQIRGFVASFISQATINWAINHLHCSVYKQI